jgi:hypothetical protein
MNLSERKEFLEEIAEFRTDFPALNNYTPENLFQEWELKKGQFDYEEFAIHIQESKETLARLSS